AHDVLFPGAGVLAFRFPLTYLEYATRTPFQAGPFRVTAMPVAHSTAIPCFGLRIGSGGTVVAFSGDTEWTDALVDLAADADVFVCECFGFDSAPPHHLDYATLGRHRAELSCRRILLTHMGEAMLERAAELGLDTASDGLRLVVGHPA
ncbi:MAG: MBL fold metallo-hydrolase, partial [Acidobacteria bacterium]|nr:MBL fold metallo-hydrolase [Acidobacteriota bacterium]